MKKISTLIGMLIVILVFTQCSKNEYLIEKNKVGLLSNVDKIGTVETVFKNDSVVILLSEGAMGGPDTRYIQEEDEYKIYSKGGKHLMTVVPKEQLDSSSTIKYIEIFDAQFETEKGLNLNSTFKDINLNYHIDRIETSISSATLYIDELNITIAVDKSGLGIDEFSREEVKIEQIPDLTRIKYFTIWFD
ncbi:MAG: hypothetical protein KAH07_01565 [Flavobacteriaceae bacterium]|nr:hypothetical protein [Flavobacteriaceae bacterium]